MERIMYAYEGDSLVRQISYKLQVTDQDTIIIYKYSNLVDSTKNMIFIYRPETEVLTFGLFQFAVEKKGYYKSDKISATPFDLFELQEGITDGKGPMLFNLNYGILNLDNSTWTYQFLFLPTGDKEPAQQILKKLKE